MRTLQTESSEYMNLLRDKNFHILNLISIVSIMSNVLNPAFRAIGDAFQITADQVGLLTTVYSIPMVILSPVVGIIADRIGRRRILGLSALIFGLSAILSVNADTYAILLFSELLRGIGQPGLAIVTIVLIGDFYTDKNRNHVMGINTAIMNAGLAVFPIIGGILAGMSWKYPYFVIFAAIPIALLAFFGLDEPEIKKEQGKILPYIKDALTYYKNGRVIAISSVSFAVYTLLAGCFLVYAAFILEDPSWIGVIFAVMSVFSCIPSVMVEPLIKKLGEENLVRITFVLFAIAFIIGANVTSVLTAMMFSAVFGLGIGIIMPVQMIMLLPLSPDHVRGAFISIQNLMHRLGQAIGPVLFGFMYVRAGLPSVFYAAATVSVIVFIISLKFLKKGK